MDNARATALHNEIAPEIVRRIVSPVIEAGGSHADILVIAESVIAGVVVFCAKNDGVSRDLVFDALVDRVRGRLDRIAGL